MKIIGFNHRSVSVPAAYPVVSSVRHADRILLVLLDVRTDEGITGISYAQAFNVYGANAIRSILRLLEETLIGKDLTDVEGHWHRMWNTIRLLGGQGLAAFALSMVDIALWDIAAKRRNVPVYRLWTDKPRQLEAYASDGCWLVSPSEAARQAEKFADQGFRAIKMRMGRTDSGDDLRAIGNIRKALGDGIDLMVDVNQGWDVDHTIQMVSLMEPYKVAWLEEPIEAEDIDGSVRLRKTISVPLATGENLYGLRSTERFIQRGASAIYTPDMQRIGGITGWRKLHSLFESWACSNSLHLFPEYAVHLLPASKYSMKLEWMSWASNLFVEPLSCVNGIVSAPEKPGFGMEWDERKVSQYVVDS